MAEATRRLTERKKEGVLEYYQPCFDARNVNYNPNNNRYNEMLLRKCGKLEDLLGLIVSEINKRPAGEMIITEKDLKELGLLICR